jgi:hypothetical protein
MFSRSKAASRTGWRQADWSSVLPPREILFPGSDGEGFRGNVGLPPVVLMGLVPGTVGLCPEGTIGLSPGFQPREHGDPLSRPEGAEDI